MAHNDPFIFLNSISWVFFAFFALYFMSFCFFLPLLFKKIRFRKKLYNIYVKENALCTVYVYVFLKGIVFEISSYKSDFFLAGLLEKDVLWSNFMSKLNISLKQAEFMGTPEHWHNYLILLFGPNKEDVVRSLSKSYAHMDFVLKTYAGYYLGDTADFFCGGRESWQFFLKRSYNKYSAMHLLKSGGSNNLEYTLFMWTFKHIVKLGDKYIDKSTSGFLMSSLVKWHYFYPNVRWNNFIVGVNAFLLANLWRNFIIELDLHQAFDILNHFKRGEPFSDLSAKRVSDTLRLQSMFDLNVLGLEYNRCFANHLIKSLAYKSLDKSLYKFLYKSKDKNLYKFLSKDLVRKFL